jgi:hypothetical protein
VVLSKLLTFHASGHLGLYLFEFEFAPGDRSDSAVLGALFDQPRKGLLVERRNRPAPRERLSLKNAI